MINRSITYRALAGVSIEFCRVWESGFDWGLPSFARQLYLCYMVKCFHVYRTRRKTTTDYSAPCHAAHTLRLGVS